MYRTPSNIANTLAIGQRVDSSSQHDLRYSRSPYTETKKRDDGVTCSDPDAVNAFCRSELEQVSRGSLRRSLKAKSLGDSVRATVDSMDR